MLTEHSLPRALTLVLVIVILGTALGAMAGNAGTMNVNDQNVFLDGYDVVSYYSEYRAVQGSAKYKTEHEGATFHFANRKNLEAFQAKPAHFMPKFGGFCAFAVAKGMGKVPTNPHTFKLYNGELLMFFNDKYEGKPFNTIVPWNADEQAMYKQAEQNWPGLSK